MARISFELGAPPVADFCLVRVVIDMKLIFALAPVILILGLTGAQAAPASCDPHAGCPDTQLGALRGSMSKELDNDRIRHIEFQKALEVAHVVMDAVTQRDLSSGVGLKSPTNSNLPYDSWLEFKGDPDVYGGICGDMQILAAHAFPAFGIEVRNVAMFSNVHYAQGALDNHASSEIWVHDRWVAVDTTFGFYFEGMLSWADAREKMLNGEEVRTIPIGDRRVDLETYPVPLPELVRYMAVTRCLDAENFCTYGTYDGKLWNGELVQHAELAPVKWADFMLTWQHSLPDYWEADR